MRIWHISDTHGYHDLLTVPEGIDLIIHTGDCSNNKEASLNESEVFNFIDWFKALPGLKLFVPGNHDTSIERGLVRDSDFLNANIMMLNHSDVVLDGIKFFGSPYTPSFGNGWAYNIKREKLNRYWDQIPEDTNVLLTHGPPKGILDLTENRDYSLEQCGDGALYKKIQKLPNLTHNLFGHIHSFKSCINHGIRFVNNITYSNACILEDGGFVRGPINNGNEIII